MGAGGCDISLSLAARKKFPFGVECKFQEKLNLWAAIRQAESNAGDEGLIPLVALKRSRSDTYIVLRIEDFLKAIGGKNVRL